MKIFGQLIVLFFIFYPQNGTLFLFRRSKYNSDEGVPPPPPALPNRESKTRANITTTLQDNTNVQERDSDITFVTCFLLYGGV